MTLWPEITASGNEEQDDNHDQDGGEAGREAGPMEVNEANSIIWLVNVGLFMRGLDVDREVSVDDGRSGGGATWVAILGNVLFDELLGPEVVVGALSI